MGRAVENNESPSYGNGSHQNQQQPRSTHHPQHQHAEAYPPYQQDDYEPAAFPPPPEKAHAFPPPHANDYEPAAFPPPASFPPNQPQPNVHVGMPPVGMPMPGGPPYNNPVNNPPPIVTMGNMGFSTDQPWKSSLFDCFNDPENALITFCFPCVTFGQIAEIVDQGNSSCGSSGFMYSLISFCIAMPCLLSCTYRTKLRNRFRLVESPGPDWIIHCFCECCALCQEYRELKERGYDPSVGWLGNAARMGMINPGIAMQAPVQPMMGR